jgi:cytosine deaminase
MAELILRGVRLPGREAPCDVAIAAGRIAAVAPAIEGRAPAELALAGRLLLPGLVDGHVALDATGGPARLGAVTRAWLDAAVRHGTTALRLASSVGSGGDLASLRVLARLRHEYADRVTVQIAAWLDLAAIPSDGVRLRDARDAGADALGAAVGREDLDAPGLATLLRVARQLDAPLDLAVDVGLPPGRVGADELALPGLLARLDAAGLGGRVRVLHATALAAVHRDELAPLLAALATRGIAVVVCPSGALRAGGRRDTLAARRGVPRLRELVAAGVDVALASGGPASDGSPLGSADLLQAAWLAAYAAHLGVPAALERVRAMITDAAARSLGLEAGYGLAPGCRADLVVLDAPAFAAAVADHAEKRHVLKAGRPVHGATRVTAVVPLATAPGGLTIRQGTLPGRSGRHDVLVVGGVIRAIVPHAAEAVGEEIPAGGRLVVPAFVEAHLHVDKAFVMEGLRLGERNLTVAEAVAAMRGAKADYTRESLLARGRRVLERALRHGVTALRAQCDVDPLIGLLALEAMVELRREWADRMDLQIVAFPQEGLVADPKAGRVMREALKWGADAAGGGPLDPDYRAHVAQVFALAREAGAAVDIHADLGIDNLRPPAEWEAVLVTELTRAVGLQGRVAIGHFAAAGAVSWEAVAPVARALAEAGVSVAALPASELYRQGLADPVNSRRGMTRLRELLAAGVNVVIASNNIRDAFVTFGDADLLEQALLAAHGASLDTEGELVTVLEMVTTRPARLLGLHHRSEVAVGQQADLVVLDAASPAEAIARQAEKLYVIRRGRVAVRQRLALDALPVERP